MKVFVGLSGGVDSAVSAALLQQQGYDVTGVFIRIVIPGYPCTAGEDKISAQRVAAHLRIPFIEIDLSKEYEQEVFRSSLEQFKKGRTPNPDTLCNEKIKFGSFYRFAKSQNVDFIATGHYAQIIEGKLYAGKDDEKDQSYFLWMVPQEVLQHTLFPVGGLHKSQVRELAEQFGLPNAARKDSQGLCFLGPISLQDMLVREIAPAPGNVLNEAGAVVGTHDGAALYTLGQRHGFELQAHGPQTPPHFVIAKNIDNNTIIVSTSRYPQHATKTKLTLTHCNWIGAIESGRYDVRFRYRQKLISANVVISNNSTEVTLDEPQYAPEGQSLVVYLPAQAGKGERCFGGGIIEHSEHLSG